MHTDSCRLQDSPVPQRFPQLCSDTIAATLTVWPERVKLLNAKLAMLLFPGRAWIEEHAFLPPPPLPPKPTLSKATVRLPPTDSHSVRPAAGKSSSLKARRVACFGFDSAHQPGRTWLAWSGLMQGRALIETNGREPAGLRLLSISKGFVPLRFVFAYLLRFLAPFCYRVVLCGDFSSSMPGGSLSWLEV